MRRGSAAVIAAPTARRSVCRSESQTNTALIAMETAVRKISLNRRIGAPRVTRCRVGVKRLLLRNAPGRASVLLALAVVLWFGRLGLGRLWHAIRADEPFPEVDGAAARGAERKRRVLLARLRFAAAGGTTGHILCLRSRGQVFKRA